MSKTSILTLGVAVCLIGSPAMADFSLPGGLGGGYGGTINGYPVGFGASGGIYELDAFVNVAGMDLNGGAYGTSAQLSMDVLPAGLDMGFSYSLTPDNTGLKLTYVLTNNTAGTLSDVRLLSFVDADINVATDGYWDEAADVIGVAGTGIPNPNMWEIDEPGYVFGDIYGNALDGALDNTNALAGITEDVSMALGFGVGDLAQGMWASMDILLSDSGAYMGSLALQQWDPDSQGNMLTMSGRAAIIPAPSALLLGLIGLSSSGLTGVLRSGGRRKGRRQAY